MCVFSGTIIMCFVIFYIRSTSVCVVCLHTLPPWNKTNDKREMNKFLLRELKQTLLAHYGWEDSPSNVSGAGISAPDSHVEQIERSRVRVPAGAAGEF